MRKNLKKKKLFEIDEGVVQYVLVLILSTLVVFLVLQFVIVPYWGPWIESVIASLR